MVCGSVCVLNNSKFVLNLKLDSRPHPISPHIKNWKGDLRHIWLANTGNLFGFMKRTFGLQEEYRGWGTGCGPQTRQVRTCTGTFFAGTCRASKWKEDLLFLPPSILEGYVVRMRRAPFPGPSFPKGNSLERWKYSLQHNPLLHTHFCEWFLKYLYAPTFHHEYVSGF